MRSLLILVIIVALSSCHALRHLGHLGKKTAAQPQEEDTSPVAIGTIEMVNPDHKFVLARLGSNLAIASGTELFTQDAAGQNVKLKLTPERKGIFVTADFTTGEPVKGGIIFAGRMSSEQAAAPQPVGPPSAVNPLPVSIAPGAIHPPMQPAATLPDSIAPGSGEDFLRIVPKQ